MTTLAKKAARLTVLIPAHNLLPSDIRTEFGANYGPTILLGGKPLFVHLRERLLKTGWWSEIDVVIATHLHAGHLNIPHQYVHLARIIEIDSSISLTMTLSDAHRELTNTMSGEELAETELFVCMGDTFLVPETKPSGTVYYMNDVNVGTYDVHRLTLFKVTLVEHTYEPLLSYEYSVFMDRNDALIWEVVKKRNLLWFQGAMFFDNIKSAVFTLRHQEWEDKWLKTDMRYPNELLFERMAHELSNKRATHTGISTPTGDGGGHYYDFGHLDTFYASKMNFLDKRAFNRVVFNHAANTITKTSDDNAFVDQCEWMLNTPVDVKPYLPAIYDHNRDTKSITMEALPYPTVSELLVQDTLSQAEWVLFYKKLESVHHRFASHARESGSINAACNDMYYNKTVNRIFKYDVELRERAQKLVGETTTLLKIVEAVYRAIDMTLPVMATLVHGDMCASNILYDRRSRILKLIDPRGSFGMPGLYGDPAYDLAKMRHSVFGGYDFILNGMYVTEGDNIVIDRNMRAEMAFPTLERAFNQNEQDRARLIEPLLFLSMVPLHSDRRDRQEAFLLKGIALLNSLREQDLL